MLQHGLSICAMVIVQTMRGRISECRSSLFWKNTDTKYATVRDPSVNGERLVTDGWGLFSDRSYRKRKERKENVNILHNGILNYNMALRNRNGNADINPTYDFNGRTLTTNDLPRIARDELRIQKYVCFYPRYMRTNTGRYCRVDR